MTDGSPAEMALERLYKRAKATALTKYEREAVERDYRLLEEKIHEAS